MNFLEALEANKTKRVRLVVPPYQGICWFEKEELRKKHDQIEFSAVTGEWEAEEPPQAVEFEYAFINGDITIYTGSEIARRLEGKRWRVRCEEIT